MGEKRHVTSKYGSRKPKYVATATRCYHFRRRQGNPDASAYTPEQLEFLRALDRYKREARRPHPSWREVLAIALALGWRKVAPPEPLPRHAA